MTAAADPHMDFLSGGGEMGARIRAHDWQSTALGHPRQWPRGLTTMLRLLLSTGHPMFLWWGPDLIQFYNDAYARSIGPERHPSALGQCGRECWVEIWPIIGPQIEQVMGGGGPTWNENQLVPITRHGSREDVYWTYSYSPIDEPGAPNGIGGILVVCTETTTRVLAEQELKMAEARWRALFEQAPGFVCTLRGPQHVFEFANPRYRRLVGDRDIIGKPMRDALPEVVSQGFVTLLDKVYQTGEPYTGFAIPVLLERQADGPREQLFVDFVYQPIRDAEGLITGILVEGSEVTEREAANEALRAADRRKDEFLAMLAHELRNPLAPIRNASVMLTRMAAGDQRTHAIGSLLERQVTQLTRLVDDLLDVARITQGRIELQRAPMELGDAMDIAVETVQPLMREGRHELSIARGTEPLHVDGDLTRLTQCVVNILTNAAKYTTPGGRIHIALARAGDEAVIEVTDNGHGIAREMLPHIFDLFVQADRTLERSQGGLGIGLSVVRKLVQMHGGQVTASSAGLGAGSRFQIRLPLVATPAIAESPGAGQPPLARRVLVVDDNVDAAVSLSQVLQMEGHEVQTVHAAAAALALSESFAADIVLLDIGLPEMDGYEVARRLRAAGSRSRIIALTGYGRSEDIQLARAAGFDAHLTKPVDFDALERLIEAGGQAVGRSPTGSRGQ
jgi:signal transduction histidine kinase/ActR/RegA family two-component response regulator